MKSLLNINKLLEESIEYLYRSDDDIIKIRNN